MLWRSESFQNCSAISDGLHLRTPSHTPQQHFIQMASKEISKVLEIYKKVILGLVMLFTSQQHKLSVFTLNISFLYG